MKIINLRWLPAALLLLLFAMELASAKTSIYPTSIVTGAISKHINDDKNRDEINPLIALEFNKKYQFGIYDNSRVRQSYSIYGHYRWLHYKVPTLPLHITSKVGAALYDNNSRYDYSLKPIGSLGARIYFDKRLFADIDYMPASLFDQGDVLALTVGYNFGGEK